MLEAIPCCEPENNIWACCRIGQAIFDPLEFQNWRDHHMIKNVFATKYQFETNLEWNKFCQLDVLTKFPSEKKFWYPLSVILIVLKLEKSLRIPLDSL